MTDIIGYKPLTTEQVTIINELKAREIELIDFITKNFTLQAIEIPTDKRWIAIAKTHIQEGFMAAVRAVTRPDGD